MPFRATWLPSIRLPAAVARTPAAVFWEHVLRATSQSELTLMPSPLLRMAAQSTTVEPAAATMPVRMLDEAVQPITVPSPAVMPFPPLKFAAQWVVVELLPASMPSRPLDDAVQSTIVEPAEAMPSRTLLIAVQPLTRPSLP